MGMGGGDSGSTVSGPATPTMAPTVPGAAYTPAKQGPVYQPNYQQYQPQQTAPQQPAMHPFRMPDYQSELPSAMMKMMQQYSRPQMKAPMQQGLIPSSSLTYRPNIDTSNLNRVAPSVELQQRLAAEEESAKQNTMFPSLFGRFGGDGG